jgi:hypothetical protein
MERYSQPTCERGPVEPVRAVGAGASNSNHSGSLNSENFCINTVSVLQGASLAAVNKHHGPFGMILILILILPRPLFRSEALASVEADSAAIEHLVLDDGDGEAGVLLRAAMRRG